MNEWIVAAVMGGASILGQLVIGYLWKRGVESKDEKIAKLEERVDEMDTRRLGDLEAEVRRGAERRRQIYAQIDANEKAITELRTRLETFAEELPAMRHLIVRQAEAATRIENIANELKTVQARQFSEAQRVADVKARVGGEHS